MAILMNRGMFADPRLVTSPTTTTAPRVGTTVQMPTAPAETMPRPTRTREPYIDSGPIIANPGGTLPIPTKQAPIVVGTPAPTKGVYQSPPIIAQPGQAPIPTQPTTKGQPVRTTGGIKPPMPAPTPAPAEEPSTVKTLFSEYFPETRREPTSPYESPPIIAQPGQIPQVTPTDPVETTTSRGPYIDSGPIIAQPGGMLPIPSTPPPRVDDGRTIEEGTEVRATEQFDEMGQQPTVVSPPPSAPDDAGGFVEEGGEVRATEDFEAMGQQAGTPAPAPAQAAVDPRALYLPDSRPPVEAAPEGMFTFIEGRERVSGDASSFLYNQISQNSEQVSIDDLRAYYNDPKKVNRLPEVFGTFDNYLAYMQEREELIRAGEYDIGNWGDAREGLSQEQLMILEGEDLFIDPTTGVDKTTAEQYKRSAQRSAYERWLNSDANKALMEKYGVQPVVYSGSGDKFEWNGTAYVKTQDVKNEGVGHYFKMAVGAIMGYYLAPALSSAIGSATGATAGATTGGITAGGVASAAAGQALSSAIVQGVTTGSVDMDSLGTAALMGGLGYIGDTIAAEGLANATSDTILADAGVALDNAIWDTAEALGTDYDTVLRIGSDIATGALTGQDVEEIALDAIQTYTTSELQNLVRTTYADSMGNIDVDNVFREGETSIPIAALNPLIETAVGGAFGEDVGAEEIGEAILEGLTYRDPDSVDADMTLSFLDPGLDIDTSLVSEFETPAWLRELEDFARATGREVEDVVRDVVRPIGEVGTAIAEQIPEVDVDLPEVDVDLPEVDIEGPDIDIASIESPDLPSFDLPSIGGLGGGAGGATRFKRTDPGGITYDPTLPELYLIPPRGMLV